MSSTILPLVQEMYIEHSSRDAKRLSRLTTCRQENSPFKNKLALLVFLALLMCCLLNEIMSYRNKSKNLWQIIQWSRYMLVMVTKCFSFSTVWMIFERERESLHISTQQFVHKCNKICLLQYAILRASSSLPMIQRKCLSYM